MTTPMAEPLRIGVLGCARITELALVAPARATGARLVAVGGRDRSRAVEFAVRHGIERVVEDYRAVLDDDEVEVVYNPLVNGWHAPWNEAALLEGKHMLTEKPFASDAAQAARVRDVAEQSGRHVVEAFHYTYHPLAHRMFDLVAGGAVGEPRTIEVSLAMPPPNASDARWSTALSGGATMDLGCYALHALSEFAQGFGGSARVVSASAGRATHDSEIDTWLEAHLELPHGAVGVARSDMTADEYRFTCRVQGTEGELFVPALIWPHEDDRIIVRRGDTEVVEHLGRRSSYTYQLEALTRLLRHGEPMRTDAKDSVSIMELIDDAYRAAGLSPRPVLTLP